MSDGRGMKVLLVNTWEVQGGAARAAHRLHLGLRASAVDSKMFVQHKQSQSPFVVSDDSCLAKLSAWLWPVLDHLPTHLYRGYAAEHWSTGLAPNWPLNRFLAKQTPNIAHLHWVCGGFMPISSLKKLRVPIVWTLHDMWPFTGGCHYAGNCNQFESGCGSCPQLHSEKNHDLSHWAWSRKKRCWHDLNITVVTPSHWLASLARGSTLFENRRVEVIPNGIDTQVFLPKNRTESRARLGLPLNKKLVLFGALQVSGDVRKGFDLLSGAINEILKMTSPDELELVVFGADDGRVGKELGFPCRSLGMIDSDDVLAAIYSAADVVVVPSREDNLPNVVMESLACGTPCVAFDVGGLPDMINHLNNGYLARPFDIDDLSHGIKWVLEDEQRLDSLSRNARAKVIDQFEIGKVSSRYLDLYQDILAT